MKRFQITAGILTVVCLVTIGIFTLIQNSLGSRLDAQLMVDRWAADGERYAQLSAFISPNANVDESSILQSMTSNIDSSLLEASLEANENARLYSYSYSAESKVTVSKINQETGMTEKSGLSATAMGVGADFFLFHRLKLLSGSYIDTYDRVLNDTIVIDNNVAWQFFGSPNVAGKTLQVNGKTCYIAGVCDIDEEYSEFYGENPRIYMSYSLLEELSGELSITCVEVCMPDPVKDFAADIFKGALGVREEYVEYVENSSRFSDSGLFALLKASSRRSVRTKLVAYPYWENTAVILADRASLLFLGKLIPIVIISIIIIIEIILGYRRRKRFFDFVKGKLSDGWEKFQQDRRRKAKLKAEKCGESQT